MKTLTAKQVFNRDKARLMKWGTTISAKRITEDPEQYQAIARIMILGDTKTFVGFGESLGEARHVALHGLSLRIFHNLTS
jgi:hypothetical protein